MRRVGITVVCALLTACATPAPPREVPPPPREAPAVAPLPPSPLTLGHYTTADGALGLVLDRSSLPPRLRVDGSSDVVELSPVEARTLFRGDFLGITYFAPDGKALLFVDSTGAMTWSPQGDKRSLARDRDADPLPAATLRGQFAPRDELVRRFRTELIPYSVLKRHPELSRDDSGDLAIVERLLKESPSEMFFRISVPDSRTNPSLFDRTSLDVTNMRVAQSLVWQPGAPGLAGFGVAATLEAGVFDPGTFQSLKLEGFPPRLVEGTVVLVWDAESSADVLLVTADAGRFTLDIFSSPMDRSPFVAPLVRELPPMEAWPTEVQHATLSLDAVRQRGEKLGVEPQPLALLAAEQERATACGRKVLVAATKDQARAREILRLKDQRDRSDGMNPLNVRWKDQIARECWQHLRDFESTYLGVLEQRKARLSELYARVRAAHAKRTASAR